MRALLIAAALLAAPAAGAAAAPAASAAAPADYTATALASANRQLDEARAEIQRLRGLAADTEAQQAQLADVRAKNERLVTIGNELIAAYEARYAKSHFVPFTTARAKFEAELQKTGEAIYQNKADAVPVRPPAENEVNEGKAEKKPR
jgi:hypothetical protein